MELRVFNTLTSRKEMFKPISGKYVGMYVCGPTVYGEPHLGHARSAITFDVIFRYLTFLEYKVRYVRNITDVGHLEDEQNETGEDKILKKARIEQLEPMEVSQYYTNIYREAMRALNVKDPSIEPSASGHIPEQIEIIEKIIDNGFAYEVNGSVYFDMKAYANRYSYGLLTGRVLEELKGGSRDNLEGYDEKRFHADFALWKKATPKHIMQWSSPWGKGFPGWHIECTAMSSKYLGVPFDIHGGGMDLKFPHHEAEISQSLAAFGKQPVKYWLHNNMVTINGEKMSKSKGNYITLNELFEGNHELLQKSYSPMVVRFYILQAHYGSTIDFSNHSLLSAESALSRLNQARTNAKHIFSQGVSSKNLKLEKEIQKYCQQCYDALNDNFNTAETIAALFELSKIINSVYRNQTKQAELSTEIVEELKYTFNSIFVDVLGLKQEQSPTSTQLDDVLSVINDIRYEAKSEKNYALADKIRNQLKEIGIQLQDNENGTTNYQYESK